MGRIPLAWKRLSSVFKRISASGTAYNTTDQILEEITGLVPALVRIVLEAYRVAAKAQEIALNDRERARRILSDLGKFIEREAEYIGEKFNFRNKRYLKVWASQQSGIRKMTYTKTELRAFAQLHFRLAASAGLRDKRNELFSRGVTTAE